MIFAPRRHFLTMGSAAAALLVLPGLKGCGGGGDVPQLNKYQQSNLVANKPIYKALFTEADFVDAWGIAIRPQGAGGHFWVGAGGTSWQYLGDVRQSGDGGLRSLSQDALKAVTVPGADSLVDNSLGKVTGVVFNGAELTSQKYRATGQKAGAVSFEGSSRFVFVTDSGKVSAWTDRTSAGGILRVDGPAQEMYDGAADGSAFFGVAIKPDIWDKLWLADFGKTPEIVTLDPAWVKVATQGFVNPFATGALGAAMPGDPVPFNIQVLGKRVFVAYALSQADPNDATAFYASEEDAMGNADELASGNKPNKGKLVEFDVNGKMVRIFDDKKRLNAPWGLAIAPASGFGKLSGALLVGNFGGAGRICAFDAASGKYLDDLRDAAGKVVAISGLWALQFGNGESLGDSNALYFAAGPGDEADGLFGSLRYAG